MIAAGFPAAVTELQQHFAIGVRFELEFLRRADPVRQIVILAFPTHERWRRQLLDAHLKYHRVVLETEHGLAAGVRVHLHVGGPAAFEAFFGGDGAINLFSRRGDANAMDEVCGHNDLSSSSTAWVGKSYKDFARRGWPKLTGNDLAVARLWSKASSERFAAACLYPTAG